MAEIITGNGIGLQDSYRTGVASSGGLAQDGTRVAVNASNGNLVLQHRDELLTGTGLDTAVLRTYNSSGVFDDANNDGFRFNFEQRLIVSIPDGNGHNTLQLTAGDGSVSNFHYDAAAGVYRDIDGSDRHDLISYDNGTNTYTKLDPQSQIRYHYELEAGGNGYRLSDRTDANGNGVQYHYVPGTNRLNWITDTGRRALHFDYIGDSVSQIFDGVLDFAHSIPSGTSNPLDFFAVGVNTDLPDVIQVVSYGYDGYDRLSTVAHQVRADNGNPSIDRTFVTTYGYASNASTNGIVDKRIASVTQDNGPRNEIRSVAIEYDGDTSVVTEVKYGGLGKTTFIDESATTTLVQYHDVDSTGLPGQFEQYRIVEASHGTGGKIIRSSSPTDAHSGNRLERVQVFDANRNLIEDSERHYSPGNDNPPTEPPLYGPGIYSRYNDQGDLLRHWNGLSEELVTYTYNAQHRVTQQTVWLESQGDATIAANDLTSDAFVPTGAHRATHYVYDSNGIDLRFVVGPDGAVVEHRHDGVGVNNTGIADATLVYTHQHYDVTTGVPSLASLESWADDLILSNDSVRRTERSFTLMGFLESETVFAHTSSSGEGVAGSEQVTNYGYDPRSGALHYVQDAENLYTVNGLDQWGQALSQRLDANYQGAGVERQLFNQLPVGHAGNAFAFLSVPNGASTTRTYEQYNDAGLLIQRYQSQGASAADNSTNNHVSNSHFVYDDQGRLLAEHRVGESPDINIYNDLSQLVAVVNGEGGVVENRYSAGGQFIAQVQYADSADIGTFLTFTNGILTGVDDALTLTELLTNYIVTDSTTDRVSEWVYDRGGRQRYAINSEVYIIAGVPVTHHYVIETEYNRAGQVIEQTAFAQPIVPWPVDWSTLNATERLSTLGGLTSVHADNRSSQLLYDNAGRLATEIDGEGYRTEYQYNAAGQLVKTSRLANTDGTPNTNLDQHSYRIYDAAGQLVGQIDAEGYLSTTEYRKNGQVLQQTRFDHRVDVSSFNPDQPNAISLSTLSISNQTLSGVSNDDQQFTKYGYNSLNEVVYELDQSGVFTEFGYDSAGQLTTIQRGREDGGDGHRNGDDDLSARRTISETQFDALGRVSQTQQGLSIAAGQSTSFAYDLAGRLISSTDTQNNTSYYYYDNDSRQRFSVNALGNVVETRYNAFGEVATTIDYAAPLINTAGLLGGGLSIELESLFTNLASTNDRQTDTKFTTRGLVRSIRDAALNVNATADWQASSAFYYNALGQVHNVDRANGRAPDYVDYQSTISNYDRRGLNEGGELKGIVAADPSSNLTITHSSVYDSFGRMISSVDGNQNATGYAYDKLGRVLTVTDALNHSSSTTYDAFNRVLTQTDARNVTTTYQYDDINRTMVASVTLSDSQAIRTETFYNVHGEMVRIIDGEGHVTEYQYDVNGNVTSTRVYDRIGDLVPISETTGIYDTQNLLESSTDANGVVTVYEYDVLLRIETLTVNPGADQIVTRTSYNNGFRTVTHTNANEIDTVTYFDHNGRVSRIVEDPAGLAILTQYIYDAEGLQLTEQRGTFIGEVVDVSYIKGYGYDSLGRRISETVDPITADHPNGLSLTTRYAYDNNGNVVKRTNANGDVSYFVYNARNEQTFSIDPLGYVNEIRYDASGRVTDQLTYKDSIALAFAAWQNGTDNVPSGTDIVNFFAQDNQSVVGVIAEGNTSTGALTRSFDLNNYGAVIDASQLSLELSGQFNAPVNSGTRWLIGFEAADGSLIGQFQFGEVNNGTGSLIDMEAQTLAVPVGARQANVSYSGFQTNGKGAVAPTDITVQFENLEIRALDANQSSLIQDGTGDAALDTRWIPNDWQTGNVGAEDTLEGKILTGASASSSLTQTIDLDGIDVASIDKGLVELSLGGDFLIASDHFLRWTVLFQRADGSVISSQWSLLFNVGNGEWQSLVPAAFMVPEGTRQIEISYTGSTPIGGKGVATASSDVPIHLDNLSLSAAVITLPEEVARHTRYVYDDLGRRVSEINDPNGLALTSYLAYDANGNIVRRTDGNGEHTYFAYNAFNQLVLTVDALGYVSEIKYDLAGQVIEQLTYRDSIAVPVAPSVESPLATWLADNASKTAPSASDISGLLAKVVQEQGEYGRQLLANSDGRFGIDSQWSGSTAGVGSVDGEHALVTYIPNDTVGPNAISQTIVLSVDGANGQLASGFSGSVIDAGNLQLAINGNYLAPSGVSVRWNAQFYDASGSALGAPLFSFMPIGNDAWQALANGVVAVPVGARSVEVSFSGFKLGGKGPAVPVTQDTPVYFNNLQVVASEVGATSDLSVVAIARQSSHIYDDLGRQRFVIDSLGYVVENRFDEVGNITATIVYKTSLSLPLWLSGAPNEGDVLDYLQTNTEDQVTTYDYDNANRLRATFNPNDSWSLYIYDSIGQLISENHYAAGELARQTKHLYDKAGRRIYSVDPLGYVTRSLYDEAGYAIGSIRYERAVASPHSLVTLADVEDRIYPNAKDQWLNTVRDTAGRIVYEIDGEGYVSEYRYNSTNQIETEIRYAEAISRAGNIIFTLADVDVELNSIDKENSQQVRYQYDADGRMLEEIRGGRGTQFVYDRVGNQTTLIDGRGDITRQDFDEVGRKLSATNIGTEEGSGDEFEDQATQTVYDAVGNVVEVIDARGHSGYFQYDTEGRSRFQIDPNGNVIEYQYDAFGNQVVSIRYANELTYVGNQQTIYQGEAIVFHNSVSETRTAGTWYVIRNTDADQRTVSSYDKLGRIVSITDAEGHSEYFELTAYGEVDTYTDKQAFESSYTYDNLGRQLSETRTVTQATATTAVQVAISQQFYDAFGNVTRLVEAAGADEERIISYEYDNNGKLVRTNQPSIQGSESVTYGEISAESWLAHDAVISIVDRELFWVSGAGFGTHIFVPAEQFNKINALGNGDWIVEFKQSSYHDNATDLSVETVGTLRSYGAGYYISVDDEVYTFQDEYWGWVNLPAYKLYKEIDGQRIEIADFTKIQSYYGGQAAVSVKTDFTPWLSLSGFSSSVEKIGVGVRYAGSESILKTISLNKLDSDEFLLNISEFGDGVYEFDGSAYNSTQELIQKFSGQIVVESGALIENIITPEVRTSNQITSVSTDVVVSNNVVDLNPYVVVEADAYGNVILEKRLSGIGVVESMIYHYYNSLNQRIATVDAERYLHEFAYDSVGNKLIERDYDARVRPDFDLSLRPNLADLDVESSTSASDLVRETHYVYDAANRVIEQRIDNIYTYNSRDENETGYRSLTTFNRYDLNGNVVHILQPNGNQRFAYYDKNNNLIAEIDGEGYITSYEYDRGNNLKSEQVYATALNATNHSTLSNLHITSFDKAGRESLITDLQAQADYSTAEIRKTEYYYDKLNRQTMERLSAYRYSEFIDGDQVSSGFLSDRVILREFDKKGNLTKVSNAFDSTQVPSEFSSLEVPIGVTHYRYDGLGRQVLEKKPIYENFLNNSVRNLNQSQYDLLGNLIFEKALSSDPELGSVEKEHVTRYKYDQYGNVIEKVDAEGWGSLYYYDSFGNVVRQQDVFVDEDGEISDRAYSYGYDGLNRLLSTTNDLGETSVNVYNGYGEIVSKGKYVEQEQPDGSVVQIGRDDYEYFKYDGAGRLIKTNQQDGIDRAYLYDANGNLTADIVVTLYNDSSVVPSNTILKEYDASHDGIRIPLMNIEDIDSYSRSGSGGQYVDRKEYEYDANSNRVKELTAAITVEELLPNQETVIKRVDLLGNPFEGGSLHVASNSASFTTGFNFIRADKDNDRNWYDLTYTFDIPSQALGDGDFLLVTDGRGGSHESTYADINGQFSHTVRVYYWWKSGAWDYPIHTPTRIYKQTDDGGDPILIADFSSLRDEVVDNDNNPDTYLHTPVDGLELRLSGINESTTDITIYLWQGSPGSLQDAIAVDLSRVNSISSFTADLNDVAVFPSGVDYHYEYLYDGDVVRGEFRLPSANEEGRVLAQYVEVEVPLLSEYRQTVEQIYYNAFGEISETIDGRGHALVNSNTAWARSRRVELGYAEDPTALTLVQKLELQSRYKTTYRYDKLGSLIEKEDPQALVSLQNGDRLTYAPKTEYYYDVVGNAIGVRDSNAILENREDYTQYAYNNQGLVTQEVTPDGGERLYEYDSFGNRVSQHVFIDNGLYAETSYEYDQLGQVVKLNLPFDSTFHSRELSSYYNSSYYDASNEVTERSETYQYDRDGRRIGTIRAGGAVERIGYDVEGRLLYRTSQRFNWNPFYGYRLDGLNVVTDEKMRYLFNAESGGYERVVTGPDSREFLESKDYHNRLLAKTDLAGRDYNYFYDFAGRLILQESDKGAEVTYYELSEGASGVQTDTNNDGFHDDGQRIEYKYYNNGLIHEVNDVAVGTRSYYEYDENGNRVVEKYATTNFGSTIYQDSAGEYDELNRLVRIVDQDAVRGSYEVNYEFDTNGNRIHVLAEYQEPNGSVTDEGLTQDYWYAYDNMNRFIVTRGALENVSGVNTVVSGDNGYEISYDKAGQRISQVRRNSSNQYLSREEYQYNIAGLITHIYSQPDALNSNEVFRVERNIYDADGNLLFLRESSNDNPDWNLAKDVSVGDQIKSEVYLYRFDNKLRVTSARASSASGGTDNTNYEYDARGNLISTFLNTVSSNDITTTYNYVYWDAAKQVEIGVEGQTPYDAAWEWRPGLSEFTYNANGHLTKVYDREYNENGGPAEGRMLSYVLDREGKIIQRREVVGNSTVGRAQDFYYFNDLGVGDAGTFGNSNVDYGTELARAQAARDGKGGGKYKVEAVTSADFDYNFQPVNSGSLGSSTGRYTILQSDIVPGNIQATLSSIAAKLWGDSALWYLLADANGLNVSSQDSVSAGLSLILPNVVTNVHNNSSTFIPYDPNAVQGNVQPTLPDAPRPNASGGGCGIAQILILIVVAIIAVVVTVVTLGAAAPAVAGLGSAFAGTAVTIGTTTLSLAGAALAGAVAGIAGSIASQLAGLALGVQDSFDWKAVAIGGVTGAVGGALGGLANGLKDFALVGVRAATAVAQNFAGQGIGIALGQQKSIDWVGVASSVVTSLAGSAFKAANGTLNPDPNVNANAPPPAFKLSSAFTAVSGRELVLNTAESFITDIAGQATAIAIDGGKINWVSTAASAIGNGLGASITGDEYYEARQDSSLPISTARTEVEELRFELELADPTIGVLEDLGADLQSRQDEKLTGLLEARSGGNQDADTKRLSDRELTLAVAGQEFAEGLQQDINRKVSHVMDRRSEAAKNVQQSYSDGISRGEALVSRSRVARENASVTLDVQRRPYDELMNLEERRGFGDFVYGFGAQTLNSAVLEPARFIAKTLVQLSPSLQLASVVGTAFVPGLTNDIKQGLNTVYDNSILPLDSNNSLEAYGANVAVGVELGLAAVQAPKLIYTGVRVGGKYVLGKLDGFVPNSSPGGMPAHLRAGQVHEDVILQQNNLTKNSSVWRPDQDDFDSSAFKVIVGDPKYTKGGQPKGTIFDSTDNGYLEIKGGSSQLNSSYQLRLETYKALKDDVPFTISTTRPVNSTFQNWLDRWGVNVVKPE